MAKFKRKKLVTTPGKWFTASVRAGRGDADREVKEAAYREGRIAYLHDSIQLLRKFYKGFEARDGYSLKRQDLTRLPAARMARIDRLAGQLRREQSSPHVVVRPKSDKTKRALYKHTGARKEKGRKAFVVHVDSPEDTKIEVIHAKGAPSRVQEVRRIDGGTVRQELFYFQDWSKKPIKTMKDILRSVRKMYKHLPGGPNDHFLLVSKDYGNISVSIPKARLDEELEIYYVPYDKVPGLGQKDNRGLGESLVALRYMGARDNADVEYAERLERRFHYAKAQKRQRESRRARRSRLLTGRVR